MTRTLARLTLLLAILGAVAPAVAHACRCAPVPLLKAVRSAEAIALVEIPADADRRVDGGMQQRSVRLLRNYRGAAGIDQVRLPIEAAACGLDPEPGSRWWLFGRREPRHGERGVLVTDACTGSQIVGLDFPDVPADAVAARLDAETAACRRAEAPLDAALQTVALRRAQPPAGIGDRIAITGPNGAYRAVSNIAKDGPGLWIDTGIGDWLQLRADGTGFGLRWVSERLLHVSVQHAGRPPLNLLLDVEANRVLSAAFAGPSPADAIPTCRRAR